MKRQAEIESGGAGVRNGPRRGTAHEACRPDHGSSAACVHLAKAPQPACLHLKSHAHLQLPSRAPRTQSASLALTLWMTRCDPPSLTL